MAPLQLLPHLSYLPLRSRAGRHPGRFNGNASVDLLVILAIAMSIKVALAAIVVLVMMVVVAMQVAVGIVLCACTGYHSWIARAGDELTGVLWSKIPDQSASLGDYQDRVWDGKPLASAMGV
ncbi:MAG: hypothetical protein ACYDGY_03295 [Acidimicrobiales bacterium]